MGLIQLQVFGLGGNMKMIDLCQTAELNSKTVLDLKKKISQKFPWEEGKMQLNFTNVRLDQESALLTKYGIEHLSCIQIVTILPGGLTPLTS